MSVSGISTTSFFTDSLSSRQSRMQQMRQEFDQLGQDLQAGNLSAAQSDFAQLQQLGGQTNSNSSNPIAQDFNQLSTDLQAGNLTAAQQDFSKIQQDFQNIASQVQGHHHHHHHHGGGSSQLQQDFSQLGQALQSGDLAAAQQAYTALQQDFQSFGGSRTTSSQTSSGTVNATA